VRRSTSAASATAPRRFFEPGEIYGFLGPNGAGKSTTVLMLTTLLPPTARVAGHDVVREGRRSGARSAPRCRRPRSIRC
jgi:ABC-type branched-subunit amino acid transport system ATPase component